MSLCRTVRSLSAVAALGLIACLFTPNVLAQAEDPADAEVTTPPTLTRFVKAEYPKSAAEQGITAVVVLEIDVDEHGAVEQVRVVEPADPPGHGFDEAAVAAVRQFEFEPARLGDDPIPVRITYRYGFTLEPKNPAPESVSETDPAPRRAPVVNYRGKVLERGTRKPMVGITVLAYRGRGENAQGFEADTDGQGEFSFSDLTTGEWQIAIENDGYHRFGTSETIAADSVTSVVYYIERVNPFDITVTATRPRKEVTRHTIASQEIDMVPGNFGDPLSVVQNLPGVARTEFGSGEIVARGSSPEDTGTLIEGISGLNLYHFGGLRSIIPSAMLDSVDFYPGNFSAVHGPYTGGLLDVRLKRRTAETVDGYVDINLFDTGVYVEVPLSKRASIAVGGRRSYVDVVLGEALAGSDSVSLVTAPRYYDGQVLAQWRPNDAHSLRFFAMASNDAFELVTTNAKDGDIRAESGEASSKQSYAHLALYDEYTPSASFKADMQLGVSYVTQNDRFAGMFIEATLSEVFSRAVATWKIARPVSLTLGGDMRVGRGVADARLGRLAGEGEMVTGPPLEDITEFNEERTSTTGSLFIEASLSPLHRLTIVPGVRADVQPWIESVTVDPRLTARLQVHDRVALKAGAGLFQQAPQIIEVLEQYGNPDLKAEEAVHYSFGAEWTAHDHLFVEATGFYKEMDNLVTSTDELVMRDGTLTPLRYQSDGSGRTWGVELMVRHKLANRFFGWLSYTYSRSERRDPGEDAFRLFDYDQPHIVTFTGSYKLPRNWEIGARMRLVSGQPNTPIVGAYYDVDLDQYTPIAGATNSERNGSFHQLDVRIDKRWVFDTWRLSAYLDIQNVYNQKNPAGYIYKYDYTEREVISGLPIFPALGIRGDF
ncbi:MAG: TonB-dependent receptor [Proteobacteria bacterium]|nr:TonB-dependent receptor [Pseudomonadota bacterium]